jgi:hypothetical protein
MLNNKVYPIRKSEMSHVQVFQLYLYIFEMGYKNMVL